MILYHNRHALISDIDRPHEKHEARSGERTSSSRGPKGAVSGPVPSSADGSGASVCSKESVGSALQCNGVLLCSLV
jgi:hypothetical protein